MIKALTNFQKTSDHYWTPWNWSTNPFPAFRGTGAVHQAFLAVANGFTPWFADDRLSISDDTSAVIKTNKGGLLLVPRHASADEHILLISAESAFRGGFSQLEVFGGEILLTKRSAKHCHEIIHLVVRLTNPNGYVMAETGDCNRSSRGEANVFSWRGGYFTLPTEEYKVAVELGNLFSAHDTIQSDLEKCRAKRAKQAESRQNRARYIQRLERVNARLEACGKATFDISDQTFFTEPMRGGSVERHLYTEEEVVEAEKKATSAEKDAAAHHAYAEWQPQFAEATKGYSFTKGRTPWRDSMPSYNSNCVVAWSVSRDQFVYYDYTAEGLAQFIKDIPEYEQEYLDKERAKAKAEVERREREAREEAERIAREAAAEKQAQAEAEAKGLGLPSNIRIWKRIGSRTGCSKGWVIGVDGVERERDDIYNENSRRASRYDEGFEIWNQILPGELVIQWTKGCTAAEHVCELIHRPETISEAQLERIAEIQQELEDQWAGLTGLASGKESPSIGDGWLGQLV